ncbi:MAG: MFS transporter, partial [Methyloceanibacter sp.]
IPAYLADVFGTQFVGAIHGRLLTAWSTAGIVGPVIVNFMHDSRKAEGIPPDQIYGPIFYVLAGLLVAGFVANLLIRPLHQRWFMSEEEVAALQAKTKSKADDKAPLAVTKDGFDVKAVLAWAAVGIPLAWGIWITLDQALVLFE